MQRKTRQIWIFVTLLTVGFIVCYQCVFSTNYYAPLHRVKTYFSDVEQKMDDAINTLSKQFLHNECASDPSCFSPFIVHIYQHDTLVFWNSNTKPTSTFGSSELLTIGISKSQNGWYYTKTKKQDSLTFLVSFLIKHEYAYQNQYLKNKFNFPSIASLQAQLIFDQNIGFPIYAGDNTYLFSIFLQNDQPITRVQSILLTGLCLFPVLILLWQLASFLGRLPTKWSWIFPIGILILRYCSLEFSWFSFLDKTELFQANLYGTSTLFPTFFDYLLNVILVVMLARFLSLKLLFTKTHIPIYLFVVLFMVAYLIWTGFLHLFQGLIENSNIPLEIDNIFHLNIYSFLTILSLAFLGLGYLIITKELINAMERNAWSLWHATAINLLLGFVYIIIEKSGSSLTILLFPCLAIQLLIILKYTSFKQKNLMVGLSLLTLYAWVCTIALYQLNDSKEKIERRLYASQLITERDINTEIAYTKLEESIRKDKFLQRLISSNPPIPISHFEDGMERRHFNQFWDRYECRFYLFDTLGQSLLGEMNESIERLSHLENLIEQHAEPSPIHAHVFFIRDYADQYNYVIKQPLVGKNNERAILYVTLKSKKIPEEIGFPRLLISSQTFVLKHLEAYSIARYYQNKRISSYGNFNYPTSLYALKKYVPRKNHYFDYQGFNHLIYYEKSNQDAIVLSKINTRAVAVATSFSYLFCFFGLLFLSFHAPAYLSDIHVKTLNLSTKIKIVLIGMVFVSLIASGISSGLFVRNQYQEYSDNAIKSKLFSVAQELKVKIGRKKTRYTGSTESSLNATLTQMAKVFHTDINFYDPHGYLLGTSRKKIFNLGLISEQINPIAKAKLTESTQQIFTHKENIGVLNYNSAYTCLYNDYGQIAGYVNLQHFGQQEEIELQIHRFLVSIINLFVSLVTISVLCAVIVSNWITSPLRMLQTRFSTIQLENNQPIQYHRQDEIGELIASYNEKIEELRIATIKMAQNERESAWREVAKQIAHEIKNPLTPMKLSVQQLMRTTKYGEIQTAEKIKKVCQSLIEQIEVMTNIINEFALFAKMPQPQFQKTNIVEVVQNVQELFQYDSTINIQTNLPPQCYVNGDKQQLTQALNNLIKNSLQASANRIVIEITRETKKAKITITDNGIGIPIEEQHNIFTPHFTTKNTGSGIGLAIVQQIINNHHGIVYFEAQKGQATKFIIELPI